MSSANVRSLAALHDARLALLRFGEQAQGAMEAWRQDVQRSLQWLEHEAPVYWKDQQAKAFNGVAAARAALETCRARTVAGHRPQCIDEQVALRKAQQRLQVTQEKLTVVRKWAVTMAQEADDFRARSLPFGEVLGADLPRMLALIDRMAAILADYAGLDSPETAHETQNAATSDAGANPLPEDSSDPETSEGDNGTSH